ncbi:NADH-quinone oxidoreductase subunit H, partial [Enterococcus hirae]
QAIEEIGRAGLRGRGGGGFPTARKMLAVRGARDVTVVCNAAEGEPATFKDRWLLQHLPWLVLEGVAVAALCVGARQAYVATKATATRENLALATALEEMR